MQYAGNPKIQKTTDTQKTQKGHSAAATRKKGPACAAAPAPDEVHRPTARQQKSYKRPIVALTQSMLDCRRATTAGTNFFVPQFFLLTFRQLLQMPQMAATMASSPEFVWEMRT